MNGLRREDGTSGAAAACRIVGAAGEAHVCAPLIALAECEVPAYPADRLPPELAAIPPVKPGSRNMGWMSVRKG
jgi:orotate phosphoribosyltransferase